MDLRKAEDRDIAERAELAEGWLLLGRCSGGRIQPQGRVCQWCEVDEWENGEPCGKPDRKRRTD
jgi:hypothetical protein